jgi:hypothetical protein
MLVLVMLGDPIYNIYIYLYIYIYIYIYIYNIPAQGTSVFVLGMLVVVARLRRVATSVDSSVSAQNLRQHTSAYVSIRQHTSAYVFARLRRVATSVDSSVSAHTYT